MKLGFVLPDALIGGFQTMSVRLANRFSKDYEVFYSVLSNRFEDSNLINEFENGIKSVAFKELIELSDIIVTPSFLKEEYKKELKEKWDKVVAIIGSYPHYKLNSDDKKKYRQNLILPPNIIVLAHFIGKLIGKKHTTIHVPVDINAFKPIDIKKKYDLLILGRMRPVKNHEFFLEICKKGNFSFLAIGGTHRWMEGHVNITEKKMRENAVSGRDYITGFISHDKVVEYINQSKLGLIVSNYEVGGGFEQMACGVPVIARDVGGVPEYFKPFKDLIVPYNAPAEVYIEKIRKYLNDIELREKVREHTVNNFSMEILYQKYNNYFQKVIKKCK